MKINFVEEMKEFFRHSENLSTDSVYVSGKIRQYWMLNHETTIIRGKVYGIVFENMKGGVWRAKVKPLHESQQWRARVQ